MKTTSKNEDNPKPKDDFINEVDRKKKQAGAELC